MAERDRVLREACFTGGKKHGGFNSQSFNFGRQRYNDGRFQAIAQSIVLENEAWTYSGLLRASGRPEIHHPDFSPLHSASSFANSSARCTGSESAGANSSALFSAAYAFSRATSKEGRGRAARTARARKRNAIKLASAPWRSEICFKSASVQESRVTVKVVVVVLHNTQPGVQRQTGATYPLPDGANFFLLSGARGRDDKRRWTSAAGTLRPSTLVT